MSFKSSYSEIPHSTLVKAYGINGNLFAKWDCQKECGLETASLALAISAASEPKVLRQSIHLVWAAVETMPPDDSATDTSPAHMANVELVLAPLRSLSETEDDVSDSSNRNCFCCTDPCDGADAFLAPRARIANCIHCMSQFLSAACRVQVPSEGCVCLLCMLGARRTALPRHHSNTKI